MKTWLILLALVVGAAGQTVDAPEGPLYIIGQRGEHLAEIDRKAKTIKLESGHTLEELVFGMLDYVDWMTAYRNRQDKAMLDALHAINKPKPVHKAGQRRKP